MKNPERLSNYRLSLKGSLCDSGTNSLELSQKLKSIPGVAEVSVVDNAAVCHFNLQPPRETGNCYPGVYTDVL